jgi:hypothetical protein
LQRKLKDEASTIAAVSAGSTHETSELEKAIREAEEMIATTSRTVTTIDPKDESEGEAYVQKVQGKNGINSLEYQGGEQLCAVAPKTVTVRVAMDSAACDHVIKPEDLPEDAEFEPNEDGKHFVGANKSPIKRFGSCKTIMSSHLGKVGCNWQMAAVSMALHSVGVVAGPKGGPAMAKQDILFNNDKCYVVAPGVVRKIMETLKAVAEYDREGNLYVGEVTLQSFHRQGQDE